MSTTSQNQTVDNSTDLKEVINSYTTHWKC